MCNAYVQCLCAMPMCNAYVQCLCAMPMCNAYFQCLCAMPMCNAYVQCLCAIPMCNSVISCHQLSVSKVVKNSQKLSKAVISWQNYVLRRTDGRTDGDTSALVELRF